MWDFVLFWAVWLQYSFGIKNIIYLYLNAWPHAVMNICKSLRHLLIASRCFELVSLAIKLALNSDSDFSDSCRFSAILGTDPKFHPLCWRVRFALSEALYLSWIPNLNSDCSFNNDFFLCNRQQLGFFSDNNSLERKKSFFSERYTSRCFETNTKKESTFSVNRSWNFLLTFLCLWPY